MITTVEKPENTGQPIRISFHLPLRTTATTRCGLLVNDFRQLEAHALNCAVILCVGYIETKLSSIGRHTARSRQGGKGCVVYRDVADGREIKTELGIALRTHPLEIEVCARSALGGF